MSYSATLRANRNIFTPKTTLKANVSLARYANLATCDDLLYFCALFVTCSIKTTHIKGHSYNQTCFLFTQMRISVVNFTSSPRPSAAVLRSRHGIEIFPEIEAPTGGTKGQKRLRYKTRFVFVFTSIKVIQHFMSTIYGRLQRII